MYGRGSGMRSLIKIITIALFGIIGALCVKSLAGAGFSVINGDAEAWPQILSSVGFTEDSAAMAQIYVGRPGSPASPHWRPKLEGGAFLLLEGESALAASFGFHTTQETVQLTSI